MFSINDLMSALLRTSSAMIQSGNSADRTEGGGTTVRFDPELRHFLECQGKAMGGLSLQSVVSMILTGVMRASTNESASARVDHLRNRLFELFDRHGIDIPTMSEILQDIDCPLSRDGLVERLDNNLLDHLVAMFDVRREWLLCQNSIITQAGKHSWIGKSFALVEHVIDLNTRGFYPRIWMLTRGRFDRATWSWTGEQGKRDDAKVAIVIEIKRTTKDGTSFSTYEDWGGGAWSDFKVRTEFRAIAKVLSDPTHEVAQSYGDAFQGIHEEEIFFPNPHVSSASVAVDPEAYDALFIQTSITAHELLETRDMNSYWSILECARQYSGEDAEDETAAVWRYFSKIITGLDQSRPWLPSEQRPNSKITSHRSMAEIMEATRSKRPNRQ